MPMSHEKTLKDTIDQLLPAGILRRVDTKREGIDVLSRAFSVTNNDGTQRVVSDYVYINSHSKPDSECE